MKKYLAFCALLTSVAALTACGSSSTAVNRVAEPIVTQSGENVGNLAVSYNEGDNTLTITDGVVVYTYAADPDGDGDYGAIKGYLRQTSLFADYALRGVTPSGSGEAFLVNATEDGYEAAAIFLNRVETTNMPVSGTAFYAGDYSGVYFIITDENSVWQDNITGRVTLDANFTDSSLSGLIYNRVSVFGGMDNVVLSASSISNGAFSGTTSGGSGGNYTASDGTYEGLFTGADADEVIGSISIPMTDINRPGFETGIFVVEDELP